MGALRGGVFYSLDAMDQKEGGDVPMTEHFRIHVERAGLPEQSDLTPVLLIQGVGVAGCAWQPQLSALGAKFPLAFFDNRGIGKSPGRPGTMTEMGEDVLEVLNFLQWPKAHLVGHSLGGVIAQQAALLAPERVRSLSLLCSFANRATVIRPSLPTLWLNLRTLIGTEGMRRRAFFEMVSDPTIACDEDSMALLEEVFKRPLHQTPPGTMAQVWALARTDFREALTQIEIPTLALGASADRVAPVSQSRVLAELLGGRFAEIKGGHACPVQQAAEVNQTLLNFLSDPVLFNLPAPPNST